MSNFMSLMQFILSGFSVRSRRFRMLSKQAKLIASKRVSFRSRDDAELLEFGAQLRDRYCAGEDLDKLKFDAFAAVEQAIWRELNIEVRETQLIGALVLYHGHIAEMATGEGKSIVALFAAFLESLSGKGVHIATPNAYLAERDYKQAELVLGRLGCSIGLLRDGMKPVLRRRAYSSDITFGAYHEFARDYLRDNMQTTLADIVQRGHAFVILDEVDAILVDEARTPIGLSEIHEPSEKRYRDVWKIISELDTSLSEIDPDTNTVFLTEQGQDELEIALQQAGLIGEFNSAYDRENIDISLYVVRALQARYLYHRDKDYVVKDGNLILIDRLTGRPMQGRRLGDGLHQALEAKENLALGPETHVIASISVQNYFRIYQKRAGMTATAEENANEFFDVYKMDVVAIPSFKPPRRKDLPEKFYLTMNEKLDAVAARVVEAHRLGQPVLVGTTSIRQSEAISHRLSSGGVKHAMLTARHDADEAEVISQAGMPGAVTIAANMAGRGTDIQLGGHPPSAGAVSYEHAAFRERRQSVLDAGGLLIIGTELHDNRRIDKQLRGRAGRQGDIGMSEFLLSFEDDFVRSILDKNPRFFEGRKLDGPLGQRWAQSFYSHHQKNIELRHSQHRIQLMRFDSVIHQQRQLMFAERLRLMNSDQLADVTEAMRSQVVLDILNRHIPDGAFIEQTELAELRADCGSILGFETDDLAAFDDVIGSAGVTRKILENFIEDRANAIVERRRSAFGPELSVAIETQALLNAIDTRWNEHQRLAVRLRDVIGLRAYGKRDPLVEYQAEVFEMFEKMLEALRFDVNISLASARPMNLDQQFNLMETLLFPAGEA